jgi:hypothetical protein
MANTRDLRLSNAAVNAEAAALAALCNSGYIRIYTGVRPTNADTAIGSQVLLAECRFGSTAFGSPADGVITANAISGEDSALATGDPSWFRVLQSNGTTVVFDGEVGTSGADLTLNTATIGSGSPVSITALVHTVTKSA